MSKASTEVTLMSLKDTYCVRRSCSLKFANSPGRREAKSSWHVVGLVLFETREKKHTKSFQSLPNTRLAYRELVGV